MYFMKGEQEFYTVGFGMQQRRRRRDSYSYTIAKSINGTALDFYLKGIYVFRQATFHKHHLHAYNGHATMNVIPVGGEADIYDTMGHSTHLPRIHRHLPT